MKTSEAQTLIQRMVADGKLIYEKGKGLLLTEKAAGTSLESLTVLTSEQASKIGQQYDPLFATSKRVSSLLKDGVTIDTLRNLLAEMEGKSASVEPKTNGAAEPEKINEQTDLTRLNGWEQTEQEALQKEAQDGETNNGELLLQGKETELGTVGTDEPENAPAETPSEPSGENSADGDIRETDDNNPGLGTPNRSRRDRGRGAG